MPCWQTYRYLQDMLLCAASIVLQGEAVPSQRTWDFPILLACPQDSVKTDDFLLGTRRVHQVNDSRREEIEEMVVEMQIWKSVAVTINWRYMLLLTLNY